MLRDTPEGKLIVTGVLTGFESVDKHAVAVNNSPFNNSSCASTGLPSDAVAPFTPVEVTVPGQAQCYGHFDSGATLGGANSVLGLGLSVYDSLVLFNKLACCTVTEVPEDTYNSIVTMI